MYVRRKSRCKSLMLPRIHLSVVYLEGDKTGNYRGHFYLFYSQNLLRSPLFFYLKTKSGKKKKYSKWLLKMLACRIFADYRYKNSYEGERG